MSESETRIEVVRVRGGVHADAEDAVATEAPLEVRVDGRTYAVLMRTPGDDRALAAGFLLSERLIRGADDLATLEHCADLTVPSADPRRNTVLVTLDTAASARASHLLAQRRDVLSSSSCGVCGRATVDSLQVDLMRIDSDVQVSTAVLCGLPEQLRSRQAVFASTGGLHAAGLFAADGTLMRVAEDVGRHNAVDKVIGASLLREELPLSRSVLVVSGRTSFELVQKAWCAGIPVVAAVSAPSSLAVALAKEAGITLAGFVRDGGLNIYAGAERLV
ncbi:MAG: formate dehydrogenase accessory sulfurtransferase FdhD [Vicinamibacterales bacterium]